MTTFTIIAELRVPANDRRDAEAAADDLRELITGQQDFNDYITVKVLEPSNSVDRLQNNQSSSMNYLKTFEEGLRRELKENPDHEAIIIYCKDAVLQSYKNGLEKGHERKHGAARPAKGGKRERTARDGGEGGDDQTA